MKCKAICIIPKPDEITIVPIVLCADCKWWKNHGATSEKWLPCQVAHTRPDWYCADGEQMKEGE